MSATLLPRPRPAPVQRRLFTAADLAAMPTSLPSGDVRYELDDGVLVTMPPPGDIHAKGQAAIIRRLYDAEDLGLGEVRGEVAVILRRNPDRVVGADAAFILAASLPPQRSPEGYLETIPEVVVEVRSKNDSRPEIAVKCDEYFAAGVREVWVLDPAARTVSAHLTDGLMRVFRDGEALTSALLPGFAQQVVGLFAGG